MHVSAQVLFLSEGQGPVQARGEVIVTLRAGDVVHISGRERPDTVDPKFPRSRLPDAFDQVVEPLIAEIT